MPSEEVQRKVLKRAEREMCGSAALYCSAPAVGSVSKVISFEDFKNKLERRKEDLPEDVYESIYEEIDHLADLWE